MCKSKGLCSPKACAINGFVVAAICLGMLIFAITEKIRYNPLNRPLECEPPPAVGTRMSLASLPSPLAEALGMVPGNAPYGVHFNMTTRSRCTNPGPASITFKSSAFEIQIWNPNATDLELGGDGMNFTLIGTSRLARDATFHNGGGQDVMVTETQFAQPLENVLASMTPEITMRGYSLGFTRNFQTIQTCSSLLGLGQCAEQPVEQFCGSYSGPCLERKLDSSGEPVAGEFEPALCVYSKALCGTEADVRAQLDPLALGVNVTGQIPCPAASGLPNTSMCNVVSALGVDPQSQLPRTIDPPMVLTPEAQAEMEAQLAAAEGLVNMLLDIAISMYVIFFISNLLQGIFCCRKHRRLLRESKNAAES